MLLISEELDELVELSDRIIAMHHGRIAGEMTADQAEIIKSVGLCWVRRHERGRGAFRPWRAALRLGGRGKRDCALLIAMIVGALLLVVSGRNPFEVYGLMATEGFGGVSRIAATLSAATPILMCAIATAIPFRAGVFNVGVEGGFYLGGLAGAVVGFPLPLCLRRP